METTLLRAQYALVQGSRAALLAHCATFAPADFTAPVLAFNHSSLRDLLVHVANCYRHWLGIVGLGQPRAYFKPTTMPDAAAVRHLFEEVDALTNAFLTHSEGRWQTPQPYAVPDRSETLPLMPLELFTHVVTHEFHHKGQLLSMGRHLGYAPVDTDVIRF